MAALPWCGGQEAAETPVHRMDQRQGFLVSVVAHLMILTILSSFSFEPAADGQEESTLAAREARPRVFLPPPEVLAELLPAPLAPPPRPAPTPRPREPKDRISIGPPSSLRAKGPLLLRREDDLTAQPKGLPDAVPSPAPRPPAERETGAAERQGSGGLRLPRLARTPGPKPDDFGGRGPIASSLESFERRWDRAGPSGAITGTERQMGPLAFDPLGADFTAWVNHFKNEVYRNWIVPQAAMLGFTGHVDLEFSVERDGRMTNLRLLASSGTVSLDRAAQNALVGSRFLPLPDDYGPPQVTMKVSFFYNETPQRS